MFVKLTGRARDLNSDNADVWILLTLAKSVGSYSGCTLAFENGANLDIISALPNLCIREKSPLEALNYALICNDRKKIELSYEANGRYDEALKFDDDDETRERLCALNGTLEEPKSESLEINAIYDYVNGNYDKALSSFMKTNNMFGKLGGLACLVKKGKKEKVAEVVRKMIDDADKDMEQILDSISMNINPELKPIFSKTAIGALRIELMNNNMTNASYVIYNENRGNILMLRLFIIEQLKSIDNSINGILDEATKQYCKTGTRESLLLRTLACIKIDKRSEFILSAEKLCVLAPSYIPIFIPMINKMKK